SWILKTRRLRCAKPRSLFIVLLLFRLFVGEQDAAGKNDSGNSRQYEEDRRQSRITEDLESCIDAHHQSCTDDQSCENQAQRDPIGNLLKSVEQDLLINRING